MNSPFAFVLSIIAIAMCYKLMNTWLKQRHVKPESNEELEETLSKIDLLEDRIKVLERIITENKFDLKSEIDSL